MTNLRSHPDVTTKILLEKRAKRKDGRYPVKLRVTHNRKQKYYVVKGLYYTLEEFKGIMDNKSRGNKKDIRVKLNAIEKRAIDIIDSIPGEFTFEAFEHKYLKHKGKNTSLRDYFETKIEELEKVGKIQSASLYRSTIKSLEKFDQQVRFEKINPMYLKSYEKWMIDNNNSYTTVGIYMRNIRHIINRAIENKRMSDYPFGQQKNKYAIPHAKNTKRALSLSDIEKMMKYKPTDHNELLALNYFLFSYLCNGMNMADVANLKFKNIKEGRIEFIRQKTRDTSREVPIIVVLLIEEIEDVIEQIGNSEKAPDNYVFPIYNQNMNPVEKHKRLRQHIKQTNKYLRRIAAKIEINPGITTYFARHSYSTILKRSGAPIEFIREQLGHQDIKVTKSYLDSFEDEQRAVFSAVLIPNKKHEKQSRN